MKKCLFLHTELAGYMLACMKYLAETKNVEVHVVRQPVNAVAPFKFNLEGKNLFFYERNNYSGNELINFCQKLNPDVIFCGGWVDRDYLDVCRKFFGRVKTVMTLDNPWRNTVRQNLAAIVGPMYLQRYFSNCWAAGSPQRKYALKLGFKNDNIKEGVYSCDFDYFHGQYVKYREQKKQNFPKKIIYVGRYTRLKGVKELWKAFELFQQRYPNEWELWCLGKGEFESEFPDHDKIKNFGFVQPSEMNKFISETGVFILPSQYEHWGVVVHEFAASGFPLLCTTSTSAASVFLENGRNGYTFEPCNAEAIVKVFKNILDSTPEQLLKMGDESAVIAKRITPDTWSRNVLEYIA
jgi:glycosyltransferase involved in cell wall biosynthesis